MAGPYIVDSVTTDELPPNERAEFWSAHVRSYQCQVDCSYADRRDFRGGTIRLRSEVYQLVESWSDGIVYNRTAGHVRQDSDEDYRLVVPVAGEMLVRQGGRTISLDHRQGGLFTTGAPVEVVQPGMNRAFVLTIPVTTVDFPSGRTAALATTVDMASGLGRVVHDMLPELIAQRHSIGQVHFDAVCDRMVELLRMVVAGAGRSDPPPAGKTRGR